MKSRIFKLPPLIFLVGAYFLSRAAGLLSLPIFADEALYLRMTKELVSRGQYLISFTDGKEPLFFWAQAVFVKIIPDPLLAGRALAVLGGMGTLVVLYFLTQGLVNRKAAVLAGLVYLFSPFALFYNRLALPDQLLTFWLALSFFFFWRAVRGKTVALAALAGVVFGLGLWTKTIAQVYIFAPLGIVALFGKREKWRLLAVFFLAAGLMFLPLKLLPGYRLVAEKNSRDFVYPLETALFGAREIFWPNFKMALKDWLVPYGGIIPLAAAAGTAGYAFLKKERKLLFFALLFFAPLILEAAVARIFFPRYLLFLTVPMALAGGYILSLVRGRLRLAAALSVFLFAPALLCGQIIFLAEKAPLPAVERWQYVSGWPSGYGTGELKEFLVSRADNQKVAVFAESFGIGEILKLYFYDREQVEINNVADGAMLAKTGDLLVLNFYPAAPGTWQVREIKRFCRVECESSIRVYEVE